MDIITKAERKGDWIQTYTRRKFFPIDPRPEEVCLDDIAHALANLCRFGGHCNTFYSVAEHSIKVARLCPEPLKKWGQLHDAAEAYLVDLPRPIKNQPGFAPYREAERLIMDAVCLRFDLSPIGEMPAAVKRADNTMMATEFRDLMQPTPLEWSAWIHGIEPSYLSVKYPLTPALAKIDFLDEAAYLGLDRR